MSEATVVLGAEHDERLRTALKEVLLALGGSVRHHDCGVGGSQELETLEVEVDGHRVTVESETYVGLSITGPSELVHRVQRMIHERLAAGRCGPP